MMSGRRYPRVLPEPVCAMPTMSTPLGAMEQPWAWIGRLNKPGVAHLSVSHQVVRETTIGEIGDRIRDGHARRLAAYRDLFLVPTVVRNSTHNSMNMV